MIEKLKMDQFTQSMNFDQLNSEFNGEIFNEIGPMVLYWQTEIKM